MAITNHERAGKALKQLDTSASGSGQWPVGSGQSEEKTLFQTRDSTRLRAESRMVNAFLRCA